MSFQHDVNVVSDSQLWIPECPDLFDLAFAVLEFQVDD